ncbi:hypothetical protein MARPU_15775 [Marichromatium purpuratum 984]|uniref:Uncharacterized protein n=1 Tax=Marichromatium purpuratum 984 TaxID=765910 RepID=W0E7E1_MARPU|nr:hypothetical protein [Marichromatium purpuratum]AHF05139.1 hypothetical protein MARPU_15775 [Marichromatium purpuratum 984]
MEPNHIPGRRERQLLRGQDNPFFGWPPAPLDPAALEAARAADQAALARFRERFAQQLERAAKLGEHGDGTEVMALKETLEQLYEESFGLPAALEREREALAGLIETIARSLARATREDPEASAALAEFERARATHFALLRQPLVGDLLDPEGPIGPTELLPTLLSVPAEEFDAALALFDELQRRTLARDGEALLARLEAADVDCVEPRRRLATLLDTAR